MKSVYQEVSLTSFDFWTVSRKSSSYSIQTEVFHPVHNVVAGISWAVLGEAMAT